MFKFNYLVLNRPPSGNAFAVRIGKPGAKAWKWTKWQM